MSLISELLDAPKETLNWLHRKYFTERPKPIKEVTNVTVRNLTPDEMLYLVDQTTMINQATMSLEWRCIMFHRQFPMRRIKKGVLRKVYRMFGVTRKKVEVSCVPARMEARVQEFEQTTLNLDNIIYDVLNSDSHLIYLDEAVFKERDFLRTSWSNHRENL